MLKKQKGEFMLSKILFCAVLIWTSFLGATSASELSLSQEQSDRMRGQIANVMIEMISMRLQNNGDIVGVLRDFQIWGYRCFPEDPSSIDEYLTRRSDPEGFLGRLPKSSHLEIKRQVFSSVLKIISKEFVVAWLRSTKPPAAFVWLNLQAKVFDAIDPHGEIRLDPSQSLYEILLKKMSEEPVEEVLPDEYFEEEGPEA